MPSKRIVVSNSSFMTANKVSARPRQNVDTLLTVDEVLNAFLTIRQRVEKWPSHSDRFCAKAKGFDNVGTAPDATIEVNLEVLEHLGVVAPDFEECKK
jgi:hypothetical protein